MIALDAQYSVRSMSDAVLLAAAASKPPVHEVAFISTAIGMVRAGLGITVVSTSSLARASMEGLVARRISDAAFAREIVVLTKRGRTLSPAAESLLAEVFRTRDQLADANRGRYSKASVKR
jgi:DNA-binding transcriptional LysR family regulator